ncbi:hypothetical protein J7E81_21830 [Bacillus sp. ISL-18]|uniref:hypothetical protein n=1 Tax=Bacillus sp. ISL-18 TaxID=2819118 RepID=UPI001BE5008F|nr:hypothetical protein [Bacillus sp. ISL-18]MBT2657845.1 hypothetical protein [Bacillus sp. ISL-18]
MKINIILGLAAFVITFLVSRVHNILNTSLFRSAIGFVVFFLMGYLVRIVLHQIQTKEVPNTTIDQLTQDRAVNPDQRE